MTRGVFDDTHAGTVAEMVIEAVTSEGYTTEECIPGLVLALRMLANDFPDPQAVRTLMAEMIEEE